MRFAGLRRLVFAFCETALLRISEYLNAASGALLAAVEWLRKKAR